MMLVLGVESEEIGLIPTDTARKVVAAQEVVTYVPIERGIAVEGLALTGRRSTETQGAVVD